METGKADTGSCSEGCRVDNHTRKLLPCFHVFCIEYLREFNRGKPPKKYACPRCQVKFVVPKGDLNYLPENFFGRRLEELNRVLLDGKTKAESETERRLDLEVECSVCITTNVMKNGIRSTSVAYCFDCQQYLCEMCFGCHNRMRLSRTHQVLRVSDCFQSVTQIFSDRGRSCEAHPSEMESLYCAICEVPMCSKCHAEECHRGHRFVPVARMSEEARTRIVDELHRIEDAKKRARDLLELVDDERKSFVENVEQVEKEINEMNQQMLDAVSTNAQHLRQELNNHNDECTRDILILDNEVRRKCLDLDQLVCMMMKIRDLVPDSATPQVAENLSRIMLQLTTPPGFRKRQESWLQSPPRADHFLPIVDETLNDDMGLIIGKFGELQVWVKKADNSCAEALRGDEVFHACQGPISASFAEDDSTIDPV